MLDEKQIAKLSHLCESWIRELEIPSSFLQNGETSFTSIYLLPWLTRKVTDLKVPSLYVRGDGGPSVRPLIWQEISFYPDLAIVEGENTYISFEIKILTDVDPGSGLTKGIGQTALYSNLGYKKSYGLFIEQRDKKKNQENLTWKSEIISGLNYSVAYFS